MDLGCELAERLVARVVCEQCGGPLPVQEGPGRKRKKCETCSPRDKRNRKVVSIPTPLSAPGGGRNVEAARRALSDVDRETSPAGELALYLAGLLDQGVGNQTAAISREYRAAMADAMKGTQQAASALDELRRRREERRRGA